MQTSTQKFPRIVFMGTPDFAVAQLETLYSAGYPIVGVVTVSDKPAGRGKKITTSPVKEFALAHNLHLLQPEKLKSEDFLSELKSLNADLFVVVAFRMLPEAVWQMPRLGTFNLHASLLPKYRGAAPINWAIINGEKETGVTTFFLNERIDEGEILFSEKILINEGEDVGSLHDRLMELGKGVVLKTVQAIAENKIAPTSQPKLEDTKAQYAPKIFKQDCLILWTKKGLDIIRLIKGLSPYPAAFAIFSKPNGEEVSLKIFDAAFEPSANADIGKIYSDKKKFLKIATPDGYISLLDVQQSGRKRMPIDEFLRGNQNISEWELKI